jgi:hypothetical protein
MQQDLLAALLELLHLGWDGQRCVRMVVNSRRGLPYALQGVSQIRMEQLPDADAEQLLEFHSGKEIWWEEGQALQLVALCGGNALTLTLVGGFIAVGRCTLQVTLLASTVDPITNLRHGCTLQRGYVQC